MFALSSQGYNICCRTATLHTCKIIFPSQPLHYGAEEPCPTKASYKPEQSVQQATKEQPTPKYCGSQNLSFSGLIFIRYYACRKKTPFPFRKASWLLESASVKSRFSQTWNRVVGREMLQRTENSGQGGRLFSGQGGRLLPTAVRAEIPSIMVMILVILFPDLVMIKGARAFYAFLHRSQPLFSC